VSFIASLLLAVADPAAGGPEVAGYRALIEQDLRLATIGYRLASANAAFCPRKGRDPGWVIHDVAQYQDMRAAFAAFAFAAPVSVAAVVKGGPADIAGVAAGDGLEAIGSKPLDWGDEAEGQPTYERVMIVKNLVRRQLDRSDSLPLNVIESRKSVRKLIKPALVCASDFHVDTKNGVDAGASGEVVRVTAGMMQFVADDTELAAVVAHEFAHNILGHRARLDAVKRGKTKAVLATEIEADRLSVWLMGNAGYDPAAALRFAERYGRKYGLGIFSDGTHLRWKNRVKLMQAEIDLMARTQKQDGKLLPPLLASK
jgi:beta-barrel assembly-enhancing protease